MQWFIQPNRDSLMVLCRCIDCIPTLAKIVEHNCFPKSRYNAHVNTKKYVNEILILRIQFCAHYYFLLSLINDVWMKKALPCTQLYIGVAKKYLCLHSHE